MQRSQGRLHEAHGQDDDRVNRDEHRQHLLPTWRAPGPGGQRFEPATEIQHQSALSVQRRLHLGQHGRPLRGNQEVIGVVLRIETNRNRPQMADFAIFGSQITRCRLLHLQKFVLPTTEALGLIGRHPGGNQQRDRPHRAARTTHHLLVHPQRRPSRIQLAALGTLQPEPQSLIRKETEHQHPAVLHSRQLGELLGVPKPSNRAGRGYDVVLPLP